MAKRDLRSLAYLIHVVHLGAHVLRRGVETRGVEALLAKRRQEREAFAAGKSGKRKKEMLFEMSDGREG